MKKPINYTYLVNILTHVVKGWKLSKELGYSSTNIKYNIEDDVFSSIDLKKIKVIVVDDNMFSRATIVRILQKTEMDISSYENANEALESLKKNSFDMAIFDYLMPIIDGLTLIKMVRNFEIDKKKKPMPIIRID